MSGCQLSLASCPPELRVFQEMQGDRMQAVPDTKSISDLLELRKAKMLVANPDTSGARSGRWRKRSA